MKILFSFIYHYN